jgi:hypothetical protein
LGFIGSDGGERGQDAVGAEGKSASGTTERWRKADGLIVVIAARTSSPVLALECLARLLSSRWSGRTSRVTRWRLGLEDVVILIATGERRSITKRRG